MDIRNIVQQLCKKYHTRDPYELVDAIGIILLAVPLSWSVRGFFQKKSRIRVIYINDSLSPELRRVVIAHELGHAVMHDDINTVFLDRYTYQITDKFEIQANRFAAELLITDDDIENYRDLTLEQWSHLTGLDEDAIRYRLCWNDSQ